MKERICGIEERNGLLMALMILEGYCGVIQFMI